MKVILKMQEEIYQSLVDYHGKHKKERLSILTGSVVTRGERMIILVRDQPTFFAEDCYDCSSPTYLQLNSEVAIKMLDQFAMSPAQAAIVIHDHWFSHASTTFSSVDDRDDLRLDKLIRAERDRLQRPFTNVAMVFDQTTFDCRIIDSRLDQPFAGVDELHTFSRKGFQVRYPNSAKKSQAFSADVVCRHDFLGAQTLQFLHNAKIGIGGLGGLGSIIAESLVRLGCRNLVLVDDDCVERSNLNRLQGVGEKDIGRAKVEAVRDYLLSICPSVKVTSVVESLCKEPGFTALTDCDLLFSGVDNGPARALLNHLAVQYMIPLFDAGVQVELNPTNFLYRVFCMLPGATACMSCSHFNLFDSGEVSRAFLSPAMQAEFRAHGYIKDLEAESAPSVYPLNMMAVGALMTDFLNYLSNFRDPTVLRYSNYQEKLLEVTEQATYINNSPAEDCPLCTVYYGCGDDITIPYLHGNDNGEDCIDDLINDYLSEMKETAG